jgi:hypothetical protein
MTDNSHSRAYRFALAWLELENTGTNRDAIRKAVQTQNLLCEELHREGGSVVEVVNTLADAYAHTLLQHLGYDQAVAKLTQEIAEALDTEEELDGETP